MKAKTILAILIFAMPALSLAQSASSRTDIASNFSLQSIAAYRESSVSMISDLYQYLNIISDSASEKALCAEVRKNILALFASDATLAYDPLSNEKLPLMPLLDKLQGKGIRFKLLSAKPAPETFSNFWIIECVLEISQGHQTKQIAFDQKVYFVPAKQKFGSTEKIVWSVRLGAVE